MNSIQTAYINALLADAAYIENIGTGEINASRFAPRLTPTQATYLAANFTVVTSIETPNTIDPQLGTGFDAVVWQIKAGSELAGPNNVNAGKLFVSMRGTQGLTDSADDITLASRGIPYDQIRDMVNWWLKNTAAVTNTQVQQIKVIEAPGLVGAKTFALDTPTNGTGLLNELDGIAGVNGHSLGGYLSTAFARIFGAAWGVEQVSTFNSAGFSNAAGLNIASEYDNIANLLGSQMGISFEGLAGLQKNYFGTNGIELTTNSAADIGIPGFNQYGQRVDLYQEDLLGSGLSGLINNHSMYKLTDYLALGVALEKLDPSLGFDKLNALVKAGSNDMKASYEGVLDGLRRIVDGPDVARLNADDVPGNAPTREAFHAALVGIRQSPAFQSLAGQLLIRPASADLKAAARNEFSAVVALQDLSPVWMSGKNAAADAQLARHWNSTRHTDSAGWIRTGCKHGSTRRRALCPAVRKKKSSVGTLLFS